MEFKDVIAIVGLLFYVFFSFIWTAIAKYFKKLKNTKMNSV